jgi:hypothetical protein
MRLTIALVLFVQAAANAADAGGIWNLAYTTPNGMKRESRLELKVQGNTLTGSLSSDRGTARFDGGKISGDEVAFDLIRNSNNDEITVHFKGKIEGNTMKLTMQYGTREPVTVIAKKGS